MTSERRYRAMTAIASSIRLIAAGGLAGVVATYIVGGATRFQILAIFLVAVVLGSAIEYAYIHFEATKKTDTYDDTINRAFARGYFSNSWIVIIGYLALTVLLGYFIYLAAIGRIQSSLVSAISTSVLTLVTLSYVVVTSRLVNETRRGREQGVKPAFSLELQRISTENYGIALWNVGNGPAQNIEAEIELQPSGEVAIIEHKSLPDDDFIPLPHPFDFDISEDIIENNNKIVASGTYSDIFGNSDDFDVGYDLSLIEQEDRDGWMMKRDEMAQIKREIGRLRRSVDKIRRKL